MKYVQHAKELFLFSFYYLVFLNNNQMPNTVAVENTAVNH